MDFVHMAICLLFAAAATCVCCVKKQTQPMSTA